MLDTAPQDSLSDAEARNIRILKAVVIVLGGLLVAGFVFVVATIIVRSSAGGDISGAPAQSVPPLNFELPKDARIARYEASEGYLIIELAFADQPRRTEILVFDLATGRQLGRVATPDS